MALNELSVQTVRRASEAVGDDPELADKARQTVLYRELLVLALSSAEKAAPTGGSPDRERAQRLTVDAVLAVTIATVFKSEADAAKAAEVAAAAESGAEPDESDAPKLF